MVLLCVVSGLLSGHWLFNTTKWRIIYYNDVPGECGDSRLIPSGRYGAAGWVLPHSSNNTSTMMLFGGYGRGQASGGSCTTGPLNDLFVNFARVQSGAGSVAGIDVRSVYGTRYTFNAGNWPGSRWGAVAWADAAGYSYIFGGYGFGAADLMGSLGDVWKWSPLSESFAWVDGTNTRNQLAAIGDFGVVSPDYYPSGRQYSSIWQTSSTLVTWIFGALPPRLLS